MPPARVPQDAGYGDRRKERDDRRRSQVQGTNAVPPSPALVRHGSKHRKIPAVLTPGQPTAFTPHPPQAHIPIGVNRANGQQHQHPYAVAAGIGAGYEYAQHNEPYKPQAYGRASPMVSSMAPVAVSNVHVRAMGGETGVSQDYNGQDFGDEPTKPLLSRIFTCRC